MTHALRRKTAPRLALMLLLAWAAAPWGAAMTYPGYENPADIKPGSERTIPLEPVETGLSYCQPLPQPPAWAEKLDLPKGLSRAWFLVGGEGAVSMGPGMMMADSQPGKVLLLDLATTTGAAQEGDFKVEQFIMNPERYVIRVRFDINEDHQFSPDECREGALRFDDRQIPGYPMRMLRLTFEKSGLTGPDGKPLPVTLTIRQNMGMGYYGGRPGQPEMVLGRAVQVTTSVPLPLAAKIGTGANPASLRLQANIQGARVDLSRYTLGKGAPSSLPYRESGRSPASLKEPLQLEGRWWVIKKIDKDLASLTLAEPGPNFKAPARGMVGETMPEWTRVDLVTRAIIAPSDFRGKYLVMTFTGNNNPQSLYSGFRLMGERLKKDGDGKVALVCVPSYIDYEQFFAQCSGNVDLPFALTPNNDIIDRSGGENARLSATFWISESQPTTIVADPEGKIILREEKELGALMGEIIPLLKQAMGKQPANPAK